MQNLPAAEKQAAVAAAAAEVSNEATPGLVATVVRAVPTEQKREAAQAAMSTLSQDQRGEPAASILGEPNPQTQQRLWYMVVGTMGSPFSRSASWPSCWLAGERPATHRWPSRQMRLGVSRASLRAGQEEAAGSGHGLPSATRSRASREARGEPRPVAKS